MTQDAVRASEAATSWTRAFWFAAGLCVVIAALRAAALILSPLDLGPDEAQYWFWSLDPDFGYYSKPPVIAWAIAATTALFGDSEWAIRLSSPLFHSGAAFLLFLSGRRLYGEAAGVWAAILYLTVPGVAFASGIISTDTPLLFFWCWALYALSRLIQQPSKGWAATLGLMVGMALMAKYAGLYFIAGIVIWTLISGTGRRVLWSRDGAVAGAVAALVFAPNIAWNALNGWPTVGHTADNANLGGELFNLEEMLQFAGDQFGVFGPFLLVARLMILIGALHRPYETRPQTSLLLCLSLPILLFGLTIAFISRAHANWAASAYVGATVLVAGAASVRHQGGRIAKFVRVLALASLPIHITAMAGLYVIGLNPRIADQVGLANAFKRVRGWETLVMEVADVARDHRVDVIVAEDRLIMGELLYYGRQALAPVLAWDKDGQINHHYEMTVAYTPERGGRVLFVSRDDRPDYILNRFEAVRALDPITVVTGRNKTRTVWPFLLEGPRTG